MERLAFISFTNEQGRDVALPACEVLAIREHEGGSSITTRSGLTYLSTSTVAAMVTKIDTLWDEYTAALGDPA